MRHLYFPVFVLLFATAVQAQKSRNIIWYTPSCVPEINGLAIGLVSGCFNDMNRKTTINGIDLEIFGVGSVLLLAGGGNNNNTFLEQGWEQVEADTVPVYRNIVNGIAISGGGLAGEAVRMNGINVGGIFTMTGKTNGISIGGIFINMNRFINGLSFGGLIANQSIQVNGIQIGGLFNASKRVRGLQIGIYNRAESLKGVQIGLWNRNSKRGLPFLNMQY